MTLGRTPRSVDSAMGQVWCFSEALCKDGTILRSNKMQIFWHTPKLNGTIPQMPKMLQTQGLRMTQIPQP